MTELYKPIPPDHVRAERDLVKFIEERLAEDRALAQSAIDDLYGEDDCYFDTSNEHISSHYLHHQPSRVLREVAAKRKLVQELSTVTLFDWVRPLDDSTAEGYVQALERVLRHLAAAYSDHSDYRKEWAA